MLWWQTDAQLLAMRSDWTAESGWCCCGECILLADDTAGAMVIACWRSARCVCVVLCCALWFGSQAGDSNRRQHQCLCLRASQLATTTAALSPPSQRHCQCQLAIVTAPALTALTHRQSLTVSSVQSSACTAAHLYTLYCTTFHWRNYQTPRTDRFSQWLSRRDFSSLSLSLSSILPACGCGEASSSPRHRRHCPLQASHLGSPLIGLEHRALWTQSVCWPSWFIWWTRWRAAYRVALWWLHCDSLSVHHRPRHTAKGCLGACCRRCLAHLGCVAVLRLVAKCSLGSCTLCVCLAPDWGHTLRPRQISPLSSYCGLLLRSRKE